MKKTIILAVALVFTVSCTTSFIQGTKMVGGAEMHPTNDNVVNAVNSNDHTTLVAAITAAELVETLKTAGLFTVFAPTNDAFNKLPEGTVGNLVKPDNKATLTKILTYHVISGKFFAADVEKSIKTGNETVVFKTVRKGKLSAKMNGKNIVLKDANGGTAAVTIANVNEKSGVIHIIDSLCCQNN